MVWNYCGDIQNAAHRFNRRWPSAFDLIRLTTGSGAMIGLHSDTVSAVCRQFAVSRQQHRRRPRWRGKKSLGWVPFIPRAVKVDGDAIVYLKRRYRFWKSRDLGGDVICGSFSEDARGRWYVNLQIEVANILSGATGEIGVELGLKTLAALSDGTTVENPRHFARHEVALAGAQRARNKRRVKAIHAKIANARRHHLHEQSTRLARQYKRIVVGNVSASKLKRTKMAKSVSDAGWYSFKQMLRYKTAIRLGEFVDADERYSSVTCSACSARSGPKGQKGLRIRQWTCSGCGVVHDRDTNAALNILAGAERRPPVAEIAA